MIKVLIFLFFLLSPCSHAGVEVGAPSGPVSDLRVIFVDVGHGDCIWITTPDDGVDGNGRYEGYNIIIDAGPSSKRIIPIMEELGLKYGSKIEWMICTHAHNDHYRGLIGLLDICRVAHVVDPGFRSRGQAYSAFCWNTLLEPGVKFYSPAIGISTIVGLESIGQSVPCRLDWGDELTVDILYSNPAVTEDTKNLSSIVIRLNYNQVSFLFTGDEEGKYREQDPDSARLVEDFLVKTYSSWLQHPLESTILKIPHHGSETSSTIPFIKAVGAKEGIIFAGRRHGLPDQSVIDRYQTQGCRVWRTDRMDQGKAGSDCHGDDHILVTTNGWEYQISYLFPDPEEGINQPKNPRLLDKSVLGKQVSPLLAPGMDSARND